MVPRLANPEIRKLKAAAQHLKPTFKIGKAGLSSQFLQSVDEGLKHHELLKVKFDEFKEQKKELAPLLAERTSSHLILQVGNVVVLYRKRPASDPAVSSSGKAAGA